jgi:Ser/Thr protein kinase RdoA (MazF antagonist)
MLDVDTAVPYLLERKLIHQDAVLDGQLTVTSVARRNRNLRVETAAGGYLIKQPYDPAEGGYHTLRSELGFYAFCRQEPAAAAMSDVLPRLAFFDSERSLLALDLLPAATGLWQRFWAGGSQAFPFEIGRQVGRTLGVVHRTFRDPALLAALALWRRSPDVPWVMKVHQPGPELLATISPANYQTLRILQTQGQLAESLDRLQGEWLPDTVIHGDVKSDNILVSPPAEPERGAGAAEMVRLVDWELVQRGDPAWDVAGVFQDAVLFWINGMALEAGEVSAMAASARFPWGILQSYLRSFWQGYRQTAGLAADLENASLLRAVAFSGARLVQTAFEAAHQSDTLPAQAVLLLQVSANLLADPESAQLQFYGIPQTFRASP